MTDLADKIERGEATDAEVTTALGWKELNPGTPLVKPWERPWMGPKGGCHNPGPPPFTTCLTTLAKECERRGWWWEKMDNTFYVHTDRNSFTGDTSGETLAGDCRALASALVRAVEGETR